MSENKMNHLLLFLVRQVYKILVVWPFQGIVSIISWCVPNVSSRPKEACAECFIITSVISPKEKELSYAHTRSVYTPEERVKQTKQTIDSIHEKNPQAKIILVEAGLEQNISSDIVQKVDQYIYVGNKFLVRHAVHSKLKSLGETMMLLCAIKQIKFDAELFFKISGRYYLDENFDKNVWATRGFKFFYIREDFVSTRLYSFNKRMLHRWKFGLIKGIPLLLWDYPVEHILTRYLPKKYIETVTEVGISGSDATTGNSIKE